MQNNDPNQYAGYSAEPNPQQPPQGGYPYPNTADAPANGYPAYNGQQPAPQAPQGGYPYPNAVNGPTNGYSAYNGQQPPQVPQDGYAPNTTNAPVNGYPPYNGQQPNPQAPQNNYPYAVYKYHTKSRLAAALLALVFGVFGVHNFYLGFNTKATIQLVLALLGIFTNIYSAFLPFLVVWIWSFVEGIQIISYHENFRYDGNGIELKD